ncbi:MAG: hypothetical protein AAF215_23615 [Cyanobacteria bacterium P01_A01_bin.123]
MIFSHAIKVIDHHNLELGYYLGRSLREFIKFSQFYGEYHALPPTQRRKFVDRWAQQHRQR